MGSSGPLLLSLREVCSPVRGGFRLLAGVSLEVARGELVAVVGMRSQGKTTLLQIAAGMVRPDRGVVCLGGRDLAGLGSREYGRVLREEVGLVGQGGPRLDLRMVDYVAAPLLVNRRRRHRRAVFGQALGALERVGMVGRAGLCWGELSRWDCALVEVAQGIVGGPGLLLVDDVTDGLGMRETAHVTRLLRGVAREQGMGVLMTASDGEAALCADRVFSLARGRLRPLTPREEHPTNVIELAGADGVSAGFRRGAWR
jgi:predicted ABC-type transport system involved in lysophospholipase L1 biosynthesis ATPase subunit